MPDIGVVNLELEIFENLAKIYQDPTNSDVTFLIGDETLAAHRLLLAAQSQVFRVLLFGEGYLESGQRDIELQVPLKAMKMLLTFVYTGKIDLRLHALPDVADLLELAHRYGLETLEKLIVKYLCIAVNGESICNVLDVACLIDCRDLVERCWMIVEMAVEGIYIVENLTCRRLIELLDRTPRKVTEVKLFEFVHNFMKIPGFCTEEEKALILSKIKFSKMRAEQFYTIVEPTRVLSKAELDNIINEFSLNTAVPLYKLSPEVPTVLLGHNVKSLFQTGDDFTTPDEQEKENCILIDLNSLYWINSMTFFLMFRGSKNFIRYYIEVSTCKAIWTEVVDYSVGRCSEHQNLYFSDIIARYIKIVCVTGKMGCNSLQVRYVENPTKSLGGFVCPEENVAEPKKAYSNFRNFPNFYELDKNLLNGNYDNHGTETAFTAHELQNGNIIVEFSQPYILSSCRFLLWDFDGRKYSYTVEVSADLILYEIISDKRDEWVDGWQTINFSPRKVMRFRLAGSDATIGNKFRLVHFEAPAQSRIVTNE